MTYGLAHTLSRLYRGQSLLRISMNRVFAAYTLRGTVVDVGGGHSPDYFSYFKQDQGTMIVPLDGSMSGIDFEKDALPYESAVVDTVILANVLEHIYDHQFLLKEIRRVLREDGQLIGFVPFWIGYHPDPCDYFRYTHDALARMFADAGFGRVDIRALKSGPILANFNTIVLSFPHVLRPVLYLWYAGWNTVFLWMRPGSAVRNPLGYVFHVHV